MECQCCKKQKHQLHPKKSDVLKGVVLLMCQSCIDAGYEPRAMVILAGRSNGPASVKEFIIKRRYLGAEILAHELIA